MIPRKDVVSFANPREMFLRVLLFLIIPLFLLPFPFPVFSEPLTLNVQDVSIIEGDTQVTFTLSLSEQALQIASVDYSTISGTATAGEDFQNTSGIISWNTDEQNKTITVTICHDKFDEEDETFKVHLSNPQNILLPGEADSYDAVCTILDNDLTPTVSINNVVVDETDNWSTFKITLSGLSSSLVSVHYKTLGNSACESLDYYHQEGTVSWSAGQTGSRWIYVPIVNDTEVETDENFSMILSDLQHATFTDHEGICTILDNDHTLSVDYTGNGKGTVSLDPPGSSYNSGTSVTLTAQPVTSCDFTGWSGDVSGSDLSTVITMDSDKTVEVGFSLKTFDITVTPGENGSITGIATGIEYGQNATFQVQANDHYHIASITKDGTDITPVEGTASKEITFSGITDGEHTLEATFAKDHYTITANAGEHGSITPESADVDHGEDQSFQITPDIGYVVESLLIDGNAVELQRTYDFIYVQSAHTISATFTMDENMREEAGLSDFRVTSLDREPDYANVLDLPAEVNPENMVALNEGDVETIGMGTTASRDVQPLLDGREMDERFVQCTSLEITYSEDQYTGVLPLELTLEVSKDLLGEDHCVVIDRNAGETSLREAFLDHMETLLVQSPDLFDLLEEAWEEFEEEQAKEFFTVTSDDNSYYVDMNLLVADAGWDSMDQAVQPLSGDQGRWFFIFDGAKDGHFEVELAVATLPLEYTIDFTVGENGNVISGDMEISGDQAITLSYNTNISFDIVPDDHYHIEALSVDHTGIESAAGETEYTYSFESLSNDHEIEVTFEIDHYTINAHDCQNGAITPASADVIYSEDVTFTISPDQYHHLNHLYVDGDPVSPDEDNAFAYTFKDVSMDHEISADFRIDEYLLSVDIIGDGTITVSPDLATYPYNTEVKLTAVPETSMDFYLWQIDIFHSFDNPILITMDGAYQVKAVFTVKTCEVDFQLATEDTNHGTITGSTSQTVDWNGSTTLVTAQANQGFHFHHWEGPGGFTSTSESLTISNVKTDQTFIACFELDEGQHQETDLEEFTITSGDEVPLIDEGISFDLPCQMTPESLDIVSRENVMTINMTSVTSGDVKDQIESRDQGEEFLQGVSFDITFESSDVETGLLPLEINMEISRNKLGQVYCEAIDMESQEKGLRASFLDHVGILKIVSPDTYDLLEEAWEEYPEEEAKLFFSISRDENSYYAGFNLLLADANADSVEMTIQPIAQSQDRYFLVFDGQQDGHFSDPLLAVKKPLPEATGTDSDVVGCDAVMPFPALIILILPILALFSKKR